MGGLDARPLSGGGGCNLGNIGVVSILHIVDRQHEKSHVRSEHNCYLNTAYCEKAT